MSWWCLSLGSRSWWQLDSAGALALVWTFLLIVPSESLTMAIIVAPALVDLWWCGWDYTLACDILCAWDGTMGASVCVCLTMALVVLGAPRDRVWGCDSASLRDSWVVRLWWLGWPGWLWWVRRILLRAGAGRAGSLWRMWWVLLR